jgi:hypothetical protein
LVAPFDMIFEVRGVEVDLAQVTVGVALSLVQEMV